MDPSHYQVLSKRIRNVVDKKRLDIMYKTIIEETNEAIIISVGNKIEFVNNAAMDLFGIEDVSDLVADQYRFLINRETNRNIPGDDKISSEYSDHTLSKYYILSKDGRDVIVDASSGPITYNGKNGRITFLRNITEKEKLEKEKKESQERFQALFELAPVGIMTFDLRGIITSINPAFEHLTGYSSDEFVGKHFLSMKTLRKTDLRNFLSMFNNILKGKNPPPFEFRYLRSDGTQSWGESHTALINISGKREFLIIAQDVSERKKLQKEQAPISLNHEYQRSGLDNDLLISIGQLGYLLSDQVLSNIKDVDDKINIQFNNSKEYNESIEEVNNILSQTLVLLDEYKKISEDTLFIPKDTIIDTIMEITKPIVESKNVKIKINKIDQMYALFDVDVLNRVLTALLKELFVLVDDVGEINIAINVREYFVEIKFEDIRDVNGGCVRDGLLLDLKKNPEINIINEYMRDCGGEILLSYESSLIVIKLPINKIKIKGEDILEKINNINYITQITK